VLQELDPLVRLALPLAIANLGQVLLGAVDTAVVGRVGAVALGAAGLGSTLFFTVAVLGTGLMLGFEPLFAQALGAEQAGRARALLQRAIVVAVLVSVPLFVVGVGVGTSLELAGLPADTAAATRTYLIIRLLGLAPYLVFVGARSYLQARFETSPVLAAVVAANLVNLVLSWLLALGDAGLARVGLPAVGLPALGVGGAAWASVVATGVQVGALLCAVGRRRPQPSFPLDRAATAQALRLGTPIGLALLAEYGVFSIVNLSIGHLDAEALAAHQVAMTFAAATFTVSLGIAAAAAVQVGRAVGAGNARGARQAGLAAMSLGGGLMIVPALVLCAAPGELASIVTDRPEVVVAAVPLLRVAACFQLSDGVQAVAAGALRGAGETRFALLANLAGHYVCGLPLGATLALGCGWGAAGFWWGLSVGLCGVAVALLGRFVRLTRTRVVPVGSHGSGLPRRGHGGKR